MFRPLFAAPLTSMSAEEIANGEAAPVPNCTPTTLKESNAKIAKELENGDRKRAGYLLAQAPMFKHFVQPDEPDTADAIKSKSPAPSQTGKTVAPTRSKAKGRMTETEEDKQLMDSAKAGDQIDVLFQSSRLTKQPSNITGKMRPYQLEGLNFLIGLFERGLNGILADEMGLGKTLQTISLLGFLRQYKGITGPHLVIVPKSTLGNWMKEIAQWCPEIRAVKFHGSQEERKNQMANLIQYGRFDVVVTTYEVASKEKAHLCKFSWRYVIIDEAHRIKNERSVLSLAVRMFTAQARMLITGTPLQNNLHELWALLNFLMPDVFSTSEVFQKWFSSVEEVEAGAKESDAGKRNSIVTELHAVLRPFLIRRLKHEVEHSLPPKKETVLFTKLSEMQLDLYRNLLKKDIDAINGKGGDRVRLLNIFMQLRKCFNHPYLFDGVEDRSLDPFGDHVIKNCGKIGLMDRLLPRLKAGNHRVLVFSQMTRVLDILEDYCTIRQYKFCRIDGSTDGDLRDQQITDFNAEGSDIFMFLLSTRAGGLGINLATADTVILYDSDWNAQCDLQAMDRAHRIGQRKQVNVYRFITENSVEQRILRRAMEKLRLDTLVIQQGRLSAQKKNLDKHDLLDMIRYGADQFFKSKESADYADEDIDVILERGAEKTKEMNKEIEEKIGTSGNMDLLDFKLGGDGTNQDKSIFHFEGVNYRDKTNNNEETPFVLDVGKRVRSKVYDESQLFRDQMAQAAAAAEKKKPKLKYRKEPVLAEHMLYNCERLREIFLLEREAVDKYNNEAEAAIRDGKEPPELPNVKESLLSPELEKERQALLDEGMSSWTRKDFVAFLKALERHGRKSMDKIVEEMAHLKKNRDQVLQYSKAFWQKGPTRIESWARLLRAIQDGEQKIAKREQMERAVQLKVDRYANAWKDLDMVYGNNRSRVFMDEEDRWLICMTNKLGYGRFEDLKLEVRKTFQFRFNWFMKSRTPLELKRRVEVLIRLIEKENEELEEAKKMLEKRKKNTERRKHSIPDGRPATSSGGPRKRKTEQSQVDSFFAPKAKIPKSS